MRGTTLPELTTVMLIIGVLASVVTPPARRFLDQAAVWGAADRFLSAHEATRLRAVTRGRLARYEIDPPNARVTLSQRAPSGSWDTLKVVLLGAVRVTASQRTVTFGPLGFGYGASNSTVVVSSGAAVETLTVSRTGRLRRW